MPFIATCLCHTWHGTSAEITETALRFCVSRKVLLSIHQELYALNSDTKNLQIVKYLWLTPLLWDSWMCRNSLQNYQTRVAFWEPVWLYMWEVQSSAASPWKKALNCMFLPESSTLTTKGSWERTLSCFPFRDTSTLESTTKTRHFLKYSLWDDSLQTLPSYVSWWNFKMFS